MEFVIPYQWTAIDLNTHANGDLRFILPNDEELHNQIIQQLMERTSYDKFITAIGREQFEQMIDYYHAEFEE